MESLSYSIKRKTLNLFDYSHTQLEFSGIFGFYCNHNLINFTQDHGKNNLNWKKENYR